MRTLIFKSFEDFLSREDIFCNGVSEDFAKENPNYEDDNMTNESCWNCKKCEYCKECFECENCEHCTFSKSCKDSNHLLSCVNCKNCAECKLCEYCVGCDSCYKSANCYQCFFIKYCKNCRICFAIERKKGLSFMLRNENVEKEVPVVKNIHKNILVNAIKPGCLDMKNWHTCETTHCRAGWAIHLAGEKGYELALLSNEGYAAILIYAKSSPEIPVFGNSFYETEDEALKDMQRCAELELEISKNCDNNK